MKSLTEFAGEPHDGSAIYNGSGRIGRPAEPKFVLDDSPASADSSRAPSPAPFDSWDSKPRTPPLDVYEATMGPWRAAIRRQLVKAVERESVVLAAMQKRVRTPFLDSYFVYTSSLGTHTFFMTALPALYFFGYSDMARGVVLVLAFGVYFSSFFKDLICSPRPFAPPVTRLTIGSHHLEYGFPSTHSTNSVSIALYILSHVCGLYNEGELSPNAFILWCTGLAVYTFSIVYGRLYTAMHSFTDCVAGVLLGTVIWAIHWVMRDILKLWITTGGWEVPTVIVLLGLIMVHKHPQPVDDCPCFEDAIAFISVVMGCLIGWWHAERFGFGDSSFVRVMPGGAYQSWQDVATWWAFAVLKMTIGISAIFTWRLVAKPALRAILPPSYRLLSHLFKLPARRFYMQATDYTSVPHEPLGLHPIPSMIDLPTQLEVEVDIRSSTLRRNVNKRARDLSSQRGEASESQRDAVLPDGDIEVVKHYDADVLTKVIVYCGIALIASYAVPVLFEVLGWGLHSAVVIH